MFGLCTFLILLPLALSIDVKTSFSVDYFVYRNTKSVCLVTCKERKRWSHEFTKASNLKDIAVSSINVRHDLNQTSIDKCFHQKFASTGIFLDINCDDFENILYLASQSMCFDSMHKWLIIIEDENQIVQFDETYAINNTGYNTSTDNVLNKETKNNETSENKIKEVLSNLNISVDCDIVMAVEKDPDSYEILDVYNIGKVQGGELIMNTIGVWDYYTGMDTAELSSLNEYKYYRRWDFRQWSMRMIMVVLNTPDDFDPSIVYGREVVPGCPMITQTPATVLNVVREIHNFRFNHTITDRWIGDFSKSSSKIVASSLYFRTQDISPVIRFIKEIREKIDVVHPPLTSIETRYYYRIPDYGVGKIENQFLRPLTKGAWGCVFAVTLLCAIVIAISALSERRPQPTQYAVFSVLGSFCQQFFEDCNTGSSGRSSPARKLSIFVTGLSCVLIYNYYTSSVVSWLLSGPPPSITSLQELLESPLELIFEDIGYTRSWLQTKTYYYNKRNAIIEDEMRKKKVFSKKKDAPLLKSLEEGIEMVKAGGFAYHTEVDSANRHISRSFTQSELCELGSLPSIEKTNLYPAVQKNSPYKEFWVWSLTRLLERGIVSCIHHRTSSSSVQCEGSSPRALALGGAAPAFLLLAFGFLLATFIMVCERASLRWEMAKSKRRDYQNKTPLAKSALHTIKETK